MRILGGDSSLSVDWRQFKRFGVPMSRVPAGAVILYKSLILYERDPRSFLAISILIAALLESENRIRSMALVHAELYEERDLAAIDLSSYARALVSQLVSSYADLSPCANFEYSGERVSFDLERAISLGLALNERMSNSLK